MRKFFVLGLPRSRTYWLSVFLGCAHEGYSYYSDYSDFMKSKYTGDSTTCYPWIKDYTNGCRKIVIERDVKEAFKASEAIFDNISINTLIDIQYELNQVKDCLRINYDDISSNLEEIWKYCYDLPFDKERADKLNDIQLENTHLVSLTKSELLESA